MSDSLTTWQVAGSFGAAASCAGASDPQMIRLNSAPSHATMGVVRGGREAQFRSLADIGCMHAPVRAIVACASFDFILQRPVLCTGWPRVRGLMACYTSPKSIVPQTRCGAAGRGIYD